MGIIIGLDTFFTILIAGLAFIIVIYSQIKISSAYSKTSKIKSKKKLTGAEVAREILDSNGLRNVHVVQTQGQLSDHYDPNRKVIKLSKEVFNTDSLAAVSVAAHECGHAIQDKENYTFLRIRAFLVPVVNFISYIGYFVTLFSLIAGGAKQYLLVGIIIIAATILFQLITLPVETNASSRAKRELVKLKLITNDEESHVTEMLSAAAFTYVAGLLNSIINLIRLVFLYEDQDRRR